jgi:hypothetical protein
MSETHNLPSIFVQSQFYNKLSKPDRLIGRENSRRGIPSVPSHRGEDFPRGFVDGSALGEHGATAEPVKGRRGDASIWIISPSRFFRSLRRCFFGTLCVKGLLTPVSLQDPGHLICRKVKPLSREVQFRHMAGAGSLSPGFCPKGDKVPDMVRHVVRRISPPHYHVRAIRGPACRTGI